MPSKDLFEYALAIRLNHISVTGNDLVKVPSVDLADAGIKTGSVAATDGIPDEPSLSHRWTAGVVQRGEDFRENARGRVHSRLAELFMGWKVEKEITFNQGLLGFVVKDELLVHVAVDEFVVKGCVKFCVNFGRRFILSSEHDGKGDLFVFLLGTLLGQTFGSQHFGVWVFLVPWSEEDVMLPNV